MIAGLYFGLVFGGAATPPVLFDPGPFVRYGLPAFKGTVHLGAAMLIGSLVLAAFALPRNNSNFEGSIFLAAAGGVLMTVASGATFFLTFLSVFFTSNFSSMAFGENLLLFATETDVGRAWVIVILLSITATVVSLLTRSHLMAILAAAIAAASLWPLAEVSHGSGVATHGTAVSSSFVHGVFAALWVGGVISLAVMGWRQRSNFRSFTNTFERFSSLALISFIVVAVSGAMNAWLRIGHWDGLFSPYGLLVAGKTLLLIGLGVFGAHYRIRLRRKLRSNPEKVGSVTARLVSAELLLMGLATGLAAALARTQLPAAPEISDVSRSPSPAEILTGTPLPQELSWERVFTLWNLDLIWILIAGFCTTFYWWGTLRLRSRGDHWPLQRVICWTLGMFLLFISTNSGLAVYSTYLFSMHMLTHMLLSMAVPLLLVLGAPVTLLSRAVAPRKDNSIGPRELVLKIVHSRYLRMLGHPVVAAVIFAVSLIVFYYSPLFGWALREHLGHQLMILHFVLSGYLFVQSIVGIDPSPHNPPYPFRLIIVLATMAFHAFFGIALITGTGLLVPEWFGAMGREWGPDPLSDQQRGGELAWGLGEFPTLMLAIMVTWSWSRSDDRKNKRRDRAADRFGDSELDEYNEMLKMLAGRESRPKSRGGS